MTTRVEITCKGPDELGIWFYDCMGNLTSDPVVRLKVGQTYTFDTHDGKRAMPFALGHTVVQPSDTPTEIYSIPQAHW